MLKQQWIDCSEINPGNPWAGKIKVRNASGRIREYDCLLYNGKEFTWQSDEIGTAVAWLGLIEVPDPYDV